MLKLKGRHAFALLTISLLLATSCWTREARSLEISPCDEGTYWDSRSRVCKGCPANCKSCRSISDCTSCKPGFYSSTPTCIACPTGCSDCLSKYTCTECESGYTLDSYECKNQSLSAGSIVGAIIGVILILVFGVLACFLIYRFCCKNAKTHSLGQNRGMIIATPNQQMALSMQRSAQLPGLNLFISSQTNGQRAFYNPGGAVFLSGFAPNPQSVQYYSGPSFNPPPTIHMSNAHLRMAPEPQAFVPPPITVIPLTQETPEPTSRFPSLFLEKNKR